MKTRANSVVISSVLWTVCLLALVPHNIEFVTAWPSHGVPSGRVVPGNCFFLLGFSALALVAVGLIIVWCGYIHRVRWTWWAMAAIAWVFMFPVYVWPVVSDIYAAPSVNWSGWLKNALAGPGVDRQVAKIFLDFLGMVVALLIPAKVFLRPDRANRDSA